MVGFRISKPTGLIPKVGVEALPDNAAQIAENCLFGSGEFRPLNAPVTVNTPSKVGTKRSIYRFGQDVVGDASYWFHWLEEGVSVARGAVEGDTTERTYYTGVAEPKMTYAAIATDPGTDYPVASYILGIPKPENTPTAVASGTGTGDVITRVYVYAYVSALGEEGPVSSPVSVNWQSGQTITVDNMSGAPVGNYNISTKRIYRAITGTNATDYQFVADVPVANVSYADSLADTALGEVLDSADWIAPPTDMQGLIALPNGMMAGFSGNDLWFCEPGYFHAWPEKYRLSMDFKIIGLGAIGTTIFVLTNGMPYLVQGGHPSAMQMVKLDALQACLNRRSIAMLEGGIAYASPDGLCVQSTGVMRVVTDKFMTRDEWQTYKPESVHGYVWDQKYIGFYDTGAVQGGFIFDPQNESFSTFTTYATTGYVDPIRNALYLMIGNDIQKFNAGAALTFNWKSKVFRAPTPLNMGAAQVIASSYPVTLEVYADGALKHSQSVANENVFRLPAGYLASKWEVRVTGTAHVREIVIAETVQDLKGM